MKCFSCSAELSAGARFCASCGTLVVDPQDATVIVDAEDPEALLHRVRMVLAGEFDVERELARGGMGVIFKATEVTLRRPVALKVLPPELGLSVRTAERFKREARMVADLDHPNIIPVYRVGQLGGVFFIAMKFIEGRSLGLILDTQGALPVPVALHVLRGAARALAYAHDRHIVHRDIKGSNILVDRDGRVLVSDYGVALRSSDVNLTVDGAVIGTPSFMSPEQCAGRRTGPQSDQYSLGIVAFQALTGSLPFTADTIAGVMQHHFFTAPPDVRATRDDVPDALVEIVNRVLQKDPAARFPTTQDMLAAFEAMPFSAADRRESEHILRQLAQGLVVPKVQTRPLPPLPDATQLLPRGGAGRRRLFFAATLAVAGVVFMGVAVGVMRLTAGRNEPPPLFPELQPLAAGGGVHRPSVASHALSRAAAGRAAGARRRQASGHDQPHRCRDHRRRPPCGRGKCVRPPTRRGRAAARGPSAGISGVRHDARRDGRQHALLRSDHPASG